MANDSQLAALLANNIAVALEKQAHDTQTSLTPLLTTAALDTAGALCAPVALANGALQAASIPFAVSAAKLARLQDEERLRVSLFLLDDAGFDIHEAPHARWLLNSKKKDLDQIPLPRRATYLYQVLGTTWQPHPAPDQPPSTPQP